MKLFKLAAVGIIFLFSSVHACMFPNHGTEYDSLIKIEKLDNKNQYYLSFPRSVNSSKGTPVVTLKYVSHAKEDKNCIEEEIEEGITSICLPLDSFSEELEIRHWTDVFVDVFIINKDDFFEHEFEIQNKEDYSIHATVMWPSEVCLTFGISTIKN
jgi:hypothetical protein